MLRFHKGATDAPVTVVPTASMAEHLRHQAARTGILVRPGSVTTLSRFLEPWVTKAPEASPAAIDRIAGQAIEGFGPGGTAGLRRIIASLIDELTLAGCTPAHLANQPALRRVLESVHTLLAERAIYTRAARLQIAARGIAEHRSIRVLGFYTFADAELDLLTRPPNASIELPEWEGARDAAERLRSAGFRSERFPGPSPPGRVTVNAARSPHEEAGHIASGILRLAEAGRPFHQCAVIVRRELPYVPLLDSTFRRFGIPFQAHFPVPLARHSIVRYFQGILDAAASGWDYAALLRPVAMAHHGLQLVDRDRMLHWLQSRLPASGLPENLAWSDAGRLRASRLTPPEWAASLGSLQQLFVPPAPGDRVSHDQIDDWRRLSAALRSWTEALQETANLLDSSRILPMASFREALDRVLELTVMPAAGQRRNAVHIIDAYEARQWRLPFAFLCGLTERSFPVYHSSHPLLGDDARIELRKQGIRLRTSAERQREEAFLFDTACRAAAEQLTLTYPAADRNGDATLPSFFLRPFPKPERAVPIQPRGRTDAPVRSGAGQDAFSTTWPRPRTLSPTGIESFLQCPFQFFAGQQLKLKPPPPQPSERLDFLLQGDILHRTLAEAEGSPLFVEEIFARLFQEACFQEAIPKGCKTERARLELQANLKRFLDSPPLKGGHTIGVERSFELPLRAGLRVRGKIDRVAEIPQRGIAVIDYKYSTRVRIRDRVRSHERGELVQGGIYLWAASKLFKRPPAAMLYCGLRGEVAWDGWHLPLFGWQEIGETWEAEALAALMDSALETASAVADRISAGEIHAAPADPRKCGWCDFRDLCRVESAPALVSIAAGSGQ